MLGFLAGIYRVELGLDQRPRLLERLPFQLAERHRVRAAALQVRDIVSEGSGWSLGDAVAGARSRAPGATARMR